MDNSKNMITDILEKYKPIIFFHKDEEYFPCNADFFVKNSHLIHNNKIIDSEMDQIKLYKIKEDEKTFIQPYNEIVKYGFRYNYEDTPLYYYVREDVDKLYIYFFLFFGYNGSYNILNIMNVGEHYNDIEHFTYEIDKKTKSLERIFFSAHGSDEGIWEKKEDIEYDEESKRPIVYCAKFGHGFYPKRGCIVRLLGFANDLTNKGYKYSNYQYLKIADINTPEFDPNTCGWFYSNIRFGRDGTKTIYTRGFLKKEDKGKTFQLTIPENVYDFAPNIIYLFFIIILMKLFEDYFKIHNRLKKTLFLTFIFVLFVVIIKLLKETIVKF